MGDYPPLEGSRFGPYQTNPRYSFQRFRRSQNVATGGSRELPSVMHLSLAFRFVCVRPIELRSAGSFPGAACWPHDSARFGWNEYREGDEIRAKAAPLQAVGDHTWS